MHSEGYSTWFVCVCLPVCLCVTAILAPQATERPEPTALVLCTHGFFLLRYGVKQGQKMLISTASSRPVFAALHTVEASEVTQRLSQDSKAAFKHKNIAIL